MFDAPPTVAAWAAAGGKKESEGPLASAFDFVTQDAAFGEQGCENWEQAESLLQRKALYWFTLYYWCRNRSETLCFYQRKCISRRKLCYW